jgi:group I intron endonuclease
MAPQAQPIAFGGIYAIRHVRSGKIYIGSAKNFSRRWQVHRRELGSGEHHSRPLQYAWTKYGPDAFVFEILEVISDAADLIRIEQEHLDYFRSYNHAVGYNVCPTAGSRLGYVGWRHTIEARAKMSAASNGKPKSDAHRASISSTLKGRPIAPELAAKRIGRKRSPEAIAKHREKMTGRTMTPEQRAKCKGFSGPHSPETRARISRSHTGRKIPREQVARQAAALRGKARPPEVVAKISEALKGRTLSPEHRARISENQRGRKASAETRAKMSASHKLRQQRKVVACGQQQAFQFPEDDRLLFREPRETSQCD